MKESDSFKKQGAICPRGPFRKLTHLRTKGWMVAVHNDYRQGGQTMTFWLFTHATGYFVKGEGKTDDLALASCVKSARLFEVIEGIK